MFKVVYLYRDDNDTPMLKVQKGFETVEDAQDWADGFAEGCDIVGFEFEQAWVVDQDTKERFTWLHDPDDCHCHCCEDIEEEEEKEVEKIKDRYEGKLLIAKMVFVKDGDYNCKSTFARSFYNMDDAWDWVEEMDKKVSTDDNILTEAKVTMAENDYEVCKIVRINGEYQSYFEGERID